MTKFLDLSGFGQEALRVGVIGINHKAADLSLRERFARVCEQRFTPGKSIHGDHICLPLTTCNRTEIYFSSADLAATHSYVLSVFGEGVGGEFDQKLYSFFGVHCFYHLARVTAGLDSAVIGETEIQGQVKLAYEGAAQEYALPSVVHYLFQKSLRVGKKMRSLLVMPKQVASQEEAAFRVCSTVFPDIKSRRILFLGASRVNRKIFDLCASRHIADLTVCNRTLEKAHSWAGQRARVIPWEALDSWRDYDVIISGTKCPRYLIGAQEAHSLTHGKLMIDLSVPRNIDPALADHPHIHIVNIDELQEMAKSLSCFYQHRLVGVEEVVMQQVRRYAERFACRDFSRAEKVLMT